MRKSRARPGIVGLRLLQFARNRIQTYVPSLDMISDFELPAPLPESANEPTPSVWRATPTPPPAPTPAPTTFIPSTMPRPTISNEPLLDGRQRRTPPDLLEILQKHEELQQQGLDYNHVSFETRRPADKPTALPSVQRAPASRPTAPRQAVPRGKPKLIEEITPTPTSAPENEPETTTPHVDTSPPEESFESIGFEPPNEPDFAEPDLTVAASAQPESNPSTNPTVRHESASGIAQRTAATSIPDAPEPALQPEAETDVEPPAFETPEQHPEISAQLKSQGEPADRPGIMQTPAESLTADTPDLAPEAKPALPRLKESGDGETEQIDYDNSPRPAATSGQKAQRLDAIRGGVSDVEHHLEAVQRNLDTIQRFLSGDPPPPESDSQEQRIPRRTAAQQPAPVSSNAAPDAMAVQPEPDQQALVESPRPPAPVVRRETYQPDAASAIRRAETPTQLERPTPPMESTALLEHLSPESSDEPRRDPPDVYEALLAAGMITPRVSQMQEFEPELWPKREESPAEQPAAHDVPDESLPEAAITVTDQPDDSFITAAEADLLKLLDMPPDTPVIRSSSPTPPGSTSLARKPYSNGSAAGRRDELEDNEDTRPLPNRSPIPLDEAFLAGLNGHEVSIQREPDNTPVPATSSNGVQATVDDPKANPNVDKLAREVYRILRDKLRIEQERRAD